MEPLLTVLIGAVRKPRRGKEPVGSGWRGILRLAVAAGLVAAGFGALNRVALSWPAPASVAYDATQQGR